MLEKTKFESHDELVRWTRGRVLGQDRPGHKHSEPACVDRSDIFRLFEQELGLEIMQAIDLYREILDAGIVAEYHRHRFSAVGFIMSAALGGGTGTDLEYQCTVFKS